MTWYTMWATEGQVEVWRPAPKRLMLLFIPTLIYGVCGTIGYPAALVMALAGGGAAEAVFPSLVGLPFAVLGLLVSITVLTGRTELRFDTAQRRWTHRFRSWLWSRDKCFAFTDVRAVQVATVGQARNSDTLVWVPTYQAVFLVNDAIKLRAHIWSGAPDEATALAHHVAALVGAPVLMPPPAS